LNPNVIVVVGEASGDAHAARVVAKLKQRVPDITISGIGGDKLRAAGMEINIDFSELAVMGLVEVLKKYRHLKGVFNQMVDRLKSQRPDLLFLVDYPGFNLKLAKEAKKLGIPVVYYISPKVWAWRKSRVKTIQRVVDKMLVLFPFEVPIYEEANVAVNCVGHPLVDAVTRTLTTHQAKDKLGLEPEHKVIGLFPGSRRSEVEVLLPLMIKAAERIKQQYPESQVVVPLAPGLSHEVLAPIIAAASLPIRLIDSDFYELTSACDAIVAASGTVTLEVALLGVPHFICYRVSPLTYKIISRLVRIPQVGLCNIVTNKALITEVLQDDVTVERLEKELLDRLTKPDQKVIAEEIRQQVLSALGPPGGADNAAQQIITMLSR
jgi:lipid-A-disaccharide synthase